MSVSSDKEVYPFPGFPVGIEMGFAVVYLAERNYDAAAPERSLPVKGRLFGAAGEGHKRQQDNSDAEALHAITSDGRPLLPGISVSLTPYGLS